MAPRKWILALSLIAAASPLSAASEGRPRMTPAPSGTPETRYCMRIEAMTGTLIELVKCWTREEWAQQGVDVDREWPREGIRTIG